MTSDVDVPTPYPKRALIAVVVSMPMAFGLNIPLNSAIPLIPIWGHFDQCSCNFILHGIHGTKGLNIGLILVE